MTAPQPDTETLVATVREAIRFDRDDHHRRCDSRKGGECDCYNRFSAPYHAALDELRNRLAETEAQRDGALADCAIGDENTRTLQRRVATLEAAWGELAGAVRRMLDDPQDDDELHLRAALDALPAQPAQPDEGEPDTELVDYYALGLAEAERRAEAFSRVAQERNELQRRLSTLEAALRRIEHTRTHHDDRGVGDLSEAQRVARAALDSLPPQPAQPEITQEQADAYLAALRRTDSIGSSQPAQPDEKEDA